MATRRIKFTINNKYVQPLKLRAGRKLVICPNSDYNSILYTSKHRAAHPTRDYTFNLWAKFAQDNFDGFHIKSYLEKDSNITPSVNYIFKVYTISTDSNWAETLVSTKAGSALPDGSFKCHITPADLPSTLDLDGEITIAIQATCSRWGKTFSKKIYVNHLGIYDSVTRLKQEIEYLDLTKLDE